MLQPKNTNLLRQKWARRFRISDKQRSIEKRLSRALFYLDQMLSSTSFTRPVLETAVLLYRTAENKNLVIGHDVKTIVAATVYAALRKMDKPWTLYEIAKQTDVDEDKLGRTYRYLARELKWQIPQPKPQDYIDRFCTKLGVSGDVRTKSLEALTQAQSTDRPWNNSPAAIAVTAIYDSTIIFNERKSKKEIERVTGIAESTIKYIRKELTERLSQASQKGI